MSMTTVTRNNVQYYIDEGLINPDRIKIDLNKTKTAGDNAHRWTTLANAIKSGYDFNFDYDVKEIKTPKVTNLPEITVTAQPKNVPNHFNKSPNKGVDMYIGANYNPNFNRIFFNTSDFDSLFGKRRIEGVKRAWETNPLTMQNWIPELAARNETFDYYNNVANVFGLPKIQYNTSFTNAYKNSRKEGQKSFIWNYKLYNTDYSGNHHKQYQEDLRSGKVDSWYKLYPNYTYPELRMAKQEELNTYGITNEQTKNKNIIDRLLVKIPARGYDIDDALKGILGEYSRNKEYTSAKELEDAIYKTYPFLKGAPLTFKEAKAENALTISKPYLEFDDNELLDFLSNKGITPTQHLIDTLHGAGNNVFSGDVGKELHRNEYNMLLGFPMSKNQDYPIPSISYYRTGSSPYYFTNNWLENSQPLLPSNIKDRVLKRSKETEKSSDYYMQMSSKLNDKARQLSGLSKREWFDVDYDTFRKYMSLAEQKFPQLNRTDPYPEQRNNFINSYFYDKNYNLKDYWAQRGLALGEGEPLVLDMKKLLSSVSPEELDKLIYYQIITPRHQLDIDSYQPGNYLATQGTSSTTLYYNQDYNNSIFKRGKELSKYLNYLRKYNIIPNKDYNQTEFQINDKNLINSTSLGRYTFSIPKNKDFVSVFDIFDIDPFGSGNDKSKFTVGKPFEYYTRFYRDSVPNINQLYQKFNLNYQKNK